VSPPWYGNRSRLQNEPNMFGERRPPHQERPTVSPPCFGNRTGKHRAFVAERGCSHATGGLRPPLLVVLRYGHLPTKLRLVRYTNARSQERRASARRGSGTAPAMAIGFRGVITFTTRDRMVHHGWLTPAALGALLTGARESLRLRGSVLHGRIVSQPRLRRSPEK
jgi:hypothetical protein